MTTETDPAAAKIERLTAEIRRLNALLKAVEGQRNEALTNSARSGANQSLLMDALKEAEQKVARLEKQLASGASPAEPPAANGAAPEAAAA